MIMKKGLTMDIYKEKLFLEGWKVLLLAAIIPPIIYGYPNQYLNQMQRSYYKHIH